MNIRPSIIVLSIKELPLELNVVLVSIRPLPMHLPLTPPPLVAAPVRPAVPPLPSGPFLYVPGPCRTRGDEAPEDWSQLPE